VRIFNLSGEHDIEGLQNLYSLLNIIRMITERWLEVLKGMGYFGDRSQWKYNIIYNRRGRGRERESMKRWMGSQQEGDFLVR
jgi:hypothetical protein